MKKELILWSAVSAAVMLFFPWLTVTFANEDTGMAVCLILFYAVNPVYTVFIGETAGKDIRHLWSLPVIAAALFLAGTWISFDMGDMDFVHYALFYAVLGIAVMVICAFVKNKTIYRKKKKSLTIN